MSKNKEDKVYDILSSIDESLRRQNSPRRVFFLGITRGLGTALGATVLLALVTSLTFQLSSSVNISSFSSYFFSDAVVE